jgi:hypothetical protein
LSWDDRLNPARDGMIFVFTRLIINLQNIPRKRRSRV